MDDPERRCLYSVDTSVFIEIHRVYPQDLFPGLWELLSELTGSGRLFVCEYVEPECWDQDIKDFLAAHPQIEVSLLDYEEHFRALHVQRQLQFPADDN